MMKIRKKIMPLFALMLVMGMMIFAVPIAASAEEPLDDDRYAEEWYEEEVPELPEEYYTYYEPAFEDGQNSFAPEGTGTVIDNATDEDGKEFYTIETPDGNVFYLIIDRQRSTNNVYFLGAVTEEDLMSLAQIEKTTEGTAGAASPDGSMTDETISDKETAKKEPATAPAAEQSSDDTTLYIIIAVAVIGIGGAGYYFKIVRPKRDGSADDDYGEDYDDSDEDNDNEEDEYDEDGTEETGQTSDEEDYEESDRDTDNGYDNTATDTAVDIYGVEHNRQRTPGPSAPQPQGQPQGNRNNNRRRKKRKKPYYSGQ